MSSPDSDREFELYTTALDHYHLSRELYWKRVSTFLAIQGFLFGALTLTGDYPEVGIIIGVFGFLFSAIWYGVMHHSEDTVLSRRATVYLIEGEIDIPYPLLEMSVEYPGEDDTLWMSQFDRLEFDPELYIPTLSGILWLCTITYFALLVVGYL